MKTVRSFMTLVGLFVAFLALGAAGARGQVLDSIQFAGTLTLPFEAQWGQMTLPVGQYGLYYGRLNDGGAQYVSVVGKAKGSPYGVIRVGTVERTSATKSALVCVREGDVLIVRALELPAIGESVSFALPHGTKLMAQKQNHSTYAQLAEVPMLIQRVPVQMNGK